jgi:hypothetical protein
MARKIKKYCKTMFHIDWIYIVKVNNLITICNLFEIYLLWELKEIKLPVEIK